MRAAAVALVLLCAACGKQGPLSPKGGGALAIPTPHGAAAAPTPDQLLQRNAQSAPVRVDDPLRSSTERPEDRFNLPPKR